MSLGFKEIEVVHRISLNHGGRGWAVRVDDHEQFLFGEEEVDPSVAERIALATATLVYGVAEELDDTEKLMNTACCERNRFYAETQHAVERLNEARKTIAYRDATIKRLTPKVKQMLRVPNTTEGRELIANMKRYLQPGKCIRLRGRLPKDGNHHRPSIPLKDACILGVYIEEKEI